MPEEEESAIGTPLGTPDKPSAGEPSAEPTVEGKGRFKAAWALIKKKLSQFKGKLRKNAIVAAVLNATFWGFGYFYNGRRKFFGIMLMTSELIALAWLYLNPTLNLWKVMTDPLVMASATLFFFALAFDAYRDAREEVEEAKKTYTET